MFSLYEFLGKRLYITIVGIGLSFLFLTACERPDSRLPAYNDTQIEMAKKKQILARSLKHFSHINSAKNAHFRLMKAAKEFCSNNLSSLTGLALLSRDDLPSETRKYIQHEPFYHRGYVVHVANNSPAAVAGLEVGDIVKSVSNIAVPPNVSAWNWLFNLERYLPMNTDIEVSFVRKGRSHQVFFQAEQGCDYPLYVVQGDQSHALTDGSRIIIAGGIVALAGNENHIAVVISHELAHIIKNHIDKKRINSLIGTFTGSVVDIGLGAFGINTGGKFSRTGRNLGRIIYSKDFEREADYIGLYLMAKAGYATEKSAFFWEKLAVHKNTTNRFSETHPTHPERYVLLRKTHQEIKNKRQNAEALIPNRIDKQEINSSVDFHER